MDVDWARTERVILFFLDVYKRQELKVGNEITATETDMSGNKSESGKGKVTDTTAPEAPSVNDTE
ncbi:hypothetical protein MU469_14215, partial [Staphylococcus aureus]|nr:hypothetical protein [Staphylococcus aureus]